MRLTIRIKIIIGMLIFGFVMIGIAYLATQAIMVMFPMETYGEIDSIMILLVLVPVIMVGGFVFGHYLSKMVVAPVKKVSAVTNQLSEGDFNVKMDLKVTNDEMGDLVLAYRKLMENSVKPLREMRAFSQAIANGDLSRDLNIIAKGEMRELMEAQVQMISNTRELVKDIQQLSYEVTVSSQDLASSAEEMNATSQQVSRSTQQISRGSSTQAERVEDTAKTVSGMAMAMSDVVEISTKAKDMSFRSKEVAAVGKKSADDAVQKMHMIQHSVTSSAAVISELGEQSEEVGQILDVITNITDQTNLLALNAAIEAARAGEQGRGFAVVAEEVKNLAEDSKEAAERISRIIRDIQTNTSRAVESMEEGTKEVTDGMDIITRTGMALEEVAQMSQKTAEFVEKISNSSEQQKAGTDIVVVAIDEIASIAEESAASAEESAAAVEELTAGIEEMTSRTQDLSKMALDLQKSAERFVIEDGRGETRSGNAPGHRRSERTKLT